MVITKFYCDSCQKENIDGEEFSYEIILVGDKLTQRKFKVCPECLDQVAGYILSKPGSK